MQDDTSKTIFSIPMHPKPEYNTVGAIYTGAHDRDGKKIYEGDILHIKGYNYIVFWNELYLNWRVLPINNLKIRDDRYQCTGELYESIDEYVTDHGTDRAVYILSNSDSWMKKTAPRIVGSVYTDDIKNFITAH